MISITASYSIYRVRTSLALALSVAALAAEPTMAGATANTTPIHSIQGTGDTSPLVGQIVFTTGVVTGRKTNGFFIQTPDSDADLDLTTSEGLFVLTGSAPPAAAAVGNEVSVQGTVVEFIPANDLNSPAITELTSPTVAVISSGNPLPAPASLTPTLPNPAGAINQLEPYEGMRVQVDTLATVSPTEGAVNEVNATSTSTGVFYGVVTGVARPFRETGIDVSDPLPTGAPATIPRFDANPERIRVDSAALSGSALLNVASGTTVGHVIGPLDYRSRTYTIDTDPASPPVLATPSSAAATPVRAPTASEFTVASFNLGRFFDADNDLNLTEPVLTSAAFNKRLHKVSQAIRTLLRSPDIVAVEEVENLAALQAIADAMNNDAVAVGQSNPGYLAFLFEGNDASGLDIGLLVKPLHITVNSVTQIGLRTTYINPLTSQPELLNDHPPLLLDATVNLPGFSNFPVTVVASHLRSLNGIDDPVEGPRVRAKRLAQAEFLANLMQRQQAANPSEFIVSAGDYNAFPFNDGYVDVMGTLKGAPAVADQVVLPSADLVNPNLINLVKFVPTAQRYSLLDNGNAQLFEQILVTNNQANQRLVAGIQYARMSADFPEIFRNDSNRPERVSTQDPVVAYFSLDAPPVCSAATPVVSSLLPLDRRLRPVGIANITDADNEPVTVTVTGICQDEAANFEGISAYAIDGRGVGTSTALVRSELGGTRRNPSNGRVYHIFFSASDGHPGGVCSGEVKVGVPLAANQAPIDGGALFNSTGPGACAQGR